jgi:HAD superfamily hydrolase (TIGR01549 family)
MKNITKTYKNLFIDLDDTLFDSSSLYDGAIKMSYERLHTFYPELTFENFKTSFLDIRSELKTKYKHQALSHNRAILFEHLLERLEIPFNAELIRELYEAYWFTVNIYIQPFPGVIETLKKIKSSGIKITAVSDGSLLSRLEKIESLKISDLIDVLVTAEEVIYTKPEKAIFELAIEKSKAKKEEVIMVGDSFSADVTGGELFGIDTCWFNPKHKRKPTNPRIKPDYVIHEFKELLELFNL